MQQRLGITAIHVTHDREEAMTMADRIVILDAGGSPRSARPRKSTIARRPPFVASFMGAENVLPVMSRAARDGTHRRGAGRRRVVSSRASAAAGRAGDANAYFRDDVATLDAPDAAPRGDLLGARPHRRAQLSRRPLSLSRRSGRRARSRSTTPHVMNRARPSACAFRCNAFTSFPATEAAIAA